ncbi:MAG: J domain-containing protein [Alphaproteobacteria bacterium]
MIAALVVALGFVLLFGGRLAGGHRRMLSRYGPAVVMGALAAWMFLRGDYWIAAGIAGAALVLWQFGEPRPRPAAPAMDTQDAYARGVLGVGPNANAADIRAAFRTKMAEAHPDRGGNQDAAARLVAARDRLLRRR